MHLSGCDACLEGFNVEWNMPLYVGSGFMSSCLL